MTSSEGNNPPKSPRYPPKPQIDFHNRVPQKEILHKKNGANPELKHQFEEQ